MASTESTEQDQINTACGLRLGPTSAASLREERGDLTIREFFDAHDASIAAEKASGERWSSERVRDFMEQHATDARAARSASA